MRPIWPGPSMCALSSTRKLSPSGSCSAVWPRATATPTTVPGGGSGLLSRKARFRSAQQSPTSSPSNPEMPSMTAQIYASTPQTHSAAQAPSAVQRPAEFTMGCRTGKVSEADRAESGKLSASAETTKGLSISRHSTPAGRARAWSVSWAEEPLVHWPDVPGEIEAALPEALETARREMEPGDAAKVLAALQSLATRRGFALPGEPELMIDAALMAKWPEDLFIKSFNLVWENFRYRRLPEVADFRAYIEKDLAERGTALQRIQTFVLKFETIRLRREWDREAREKHAALRAAERIRGAKPAAKTVASDTAQQERGAGLAARGPCSERLDEGDGRSDEVDTVVGDAGELDLVLLGLGEAQHHVGVAHAGVQRAGPVGLS